MADGSGGRRRNLNLGGGICPTGSDIAIIVGICGGSSGINDCDPDQSKAQKQMLAWWRDGVTAIPN